jgi:2-polyprenyl-3-methyl-5-hydroxy-6-metoxy-1,4-benzoquinol methylase
MGGILKKIDKSNFQEFCPCCEGKSWDVLYEGKIRDGSFGKITDGCHRVYQCQKCHLARLEKFVIGENEYQTDDYRERYNDSADDLTLLRIHDPEQGSKVALIGFEKLRGKTVIDYGCGHGAFLDAVAGVTRSTIGIEPLISIRNSLEKRGHLVYNTVNDALIDYRGKVDILTLFGVIEHLDDPAFCLKAVFELLAENGMLVIQTDNLDDILMKTEAKGFAEFFFRTAHNWYFLPSNIDKMVQNCGFTETHVTTTCGFDFSNFVNWHKLGRPTGIAKNGSFDPIFEAVWKSSIERALHGDLITVLAYK